MKEKIEQLNFSELSKSDAQDLLNELLTHDGQDFKDLVTVIIDTIDTNTVNSDTVSESIELIFNNDRVKLVVDELLNEYNIQED